MPILQRGIGKYIINVFFPIHFSVKLRISVRNGIYKEGRDFLTTENRDTFHKLKGFFKKWVCLILWQENMQN